METTSLRQALERESQAWISLETAKGVRANELLSDAQTHADVYAVKLLINGDSDIRALAEEWEQARIDLMLICREHDILDPYRTIAAVRLSTV